MQIPIFSATLYNSRMMTIDEIRRENLKILIDEFGTATALSKVVGRDAPQLSQWKNASPNSETGRPRVMTSDVCREFEEKCGKERGWFDHFHPKKPNVMMELSPEEVKVVETYRSSSTARVLIDGAINTSFNLGSSTDSRAGKESAI